jgi:hypothetical protein
MTIHDFCRIAALRRNRLAASHFGRFHSGTPFHFPPQGLGQCWPCAAKGHNGRAAEERDEFAALNPSPRRRPRAVMLEL